MTPSIAIIGGGMVGMALALLLRREGQSQVTLIEATPPACHDLSSPSFDARSTALSLGSIRILETLGAAEYLLSHSEPILRVHVSRQGAWGNTTLDASVLGVPCLGAVAENRHLAQALLQALSADSCIHLMTPFQLVKAQRQQHGWLYTLDDGSTHSCDLLVAADGARSTTRDLLGISARHEDSGWAALVANVTPHTPHEQLARERFLAGGPLALLPLQENRQALVWTGTEENIRELGSMTERTFLKTLKAAMPRDHDGFSRVGRRHHYPLILTQACAQAVPYAVLAGNAAHTLHPVAGQGFNLALRDIDALARYIGKSHSPGTLSTLNQWADGRARDQLRIMTASRALPSLFQPSHGLFALGRQGGLLTMALCPDLQKTFALEAMGLRGHQQALTGKRMT